MNTSPLTIGEFQIHWLNGGDFMLDGGTMFGPVPKILWQRKYKADSRNLQHYCNDVLLVCTPDKNIIVDTGLGNKLSAKQLAIFQVKTPWSLIDDLAKRGLTRQDIDMVLLTHCDFDHAGGAVMHNQQGEKELTFPNAIHYIQESEWEDVNSPCHRAQSTYWPENFTLLRQEENLSIISGDHEVIPGITLRHSGGHTLGHQIVEICSGGETAIHLADLFPTHHHSNPLWVMAYDNFPLEVIDRKEEYFKHYQSLNSWFTFYHDPLVKACKLDTNNRVSLTWPSP